MTDRIRHLTVTLDRDFREDDAELLIRAIVMIRGVAAVKPHVVQVDDLLARDAVRADLRTQLHAAIEACFKKEKHES